MHDQPSPPAFPQHASAPGVRLSFPITVHIAHCVVQTGDPEFQQKVLNHFSAQHAQGVQIMSQISDFAGRVQANVDKLTADIDAVAQLVQTLQTSAGQITPEDQATLDALEQKVATLTGNADKLVPPVPGGATPPTP
jgi:predicted Mrr-cat superfamily restriction endonuclease